MVESNEILVIISMTGQKYYSSAKVLMATFKGKINIDLITEQLCSIFFLKSMNSMQSTIFPNFYINSNRNTFFIPDKA